MIFTTKISTTFAWKDPVFYLAQVQREHPRVRNREHSAHANRYAYFAMILREISGPTQARAYSGAPHGHQDLVKGNAAFEPGSKDRQKPKAS